jgi:hypothetical protein
MTSFLCCPVWAAKKKNSEAFRVQAMPVAEGRTGASAQQQATDGDNDD